MLLSELVQDVRVKHAAYLESSMSIAPPPATAESFCIACLRRSSTKFFPYNACLSISDLTINDGVDSTNMDTASVRRARTAHSPPSTARRPHAG